MTYSKHRRIEIDFQTALFGVYERLAWSETQFGTQFGCSYLSVFKSRQRAEIQLSARHVLFRFQSYRSLKTPVFLALESYLLPVIEHHLVYFRPFERCKDIVLIGVHELIGRRTYVVCGHQGKCPLGKLSRKILFLIERIHKFALVVVLMASPSVRIITAEEQLFMKLCRCLGCNPRK